MSPRTGVLESWKTTVSIRLGMLVQFYSVTQAGCLRPGPVTPAQRSPPLSELCVKSPFATIRLRPPLTKFHRDRIAHPDRPLTIRNHVDSEHRCLADQPVLGQGLQGLWPEAFARIL